MTENKPKLSVIMPAFNSVDYIREAIDSILNQTFQNFEFLIIDDGSTDQTYEVIEEYTIKDRRIVSLKNEKNMGISAALNLGISMAKGEYIARMDADDWSYPDRFEKQVRYMDTNTEIGISGTAMEICNAKLKKMGIRRYHLSNHLIRGRIFFHSPFCHAATMMRSNILKKNNLLYNPGFDGAEDYDLFFRIGKYCDFGNLPEELYKMRVLTSSISNSKALHQEKLTLYIRLKAVFEYGYDMNRLEGLYTFFQYISIFIIPRRLKVMLFNKLRQKI